MPSVCLKCGGRHWLAAMAGGPGDEEGNGYAAALLAEFLILIGWVQLRMPMVKHWDNCINAIILLYNVHRFKEDPEYGEMLKRMWNGDLSTEDCKRINTSKVIGYNGLQLPSHLEGKIPKR
jgi:hypothetical protein